MPELTEVAYMPLESMTIEVHLRETAMKDLKLADIYGFMNFSTCLPELEYELVN